MCLEWKFIDFVITQTFRLNVTDSVKCLEWNGQFDGQCLRVDVETFLLMFLFLKKRCRFVYLFVSSFWPSNPHFHGMWQQDVICHT